MSLYNQQNQGSNIGTPGISKAPKTTKRVADIILNKKHPAYTGPDSIGIIFFIDEKTKEFTKDPTTLPRAKPKNLNNYTTPLIGELVNVFESTSDDYYSDLGGDSNITSNYYTEAINVWNSAGSNALPLAKKNFQSKKEKTRESTPNFKIEKEFKSSSQEVALKMLNQYLRTLGYLGRSDPQSPKYTLFQEGSGGDFIYRLNEGQDIKLGSYYKEDPNQKNLNLTEGGTVNQGKAGQRISYSANDKANVGDINEQNRAMVLSLGNNEEENINDDDGTIHLATNRKVNIKTSSNLIASLNSEYIPPTEALDDIAKEVVLDIDKTELTPNPEFQTQDLKFDLSSQDTPVKEVVTTPPPYIEEGYTVFDALDEAIEEELITEDPMENEAISGTVADPAIELILPNGFPISGNDIPDNDVSKDILIEYPNASGYSAQNIIDNMATDIKNKKYRKNNLVAINKLADAAWKAGDYNKAAYTNKYGAIILLPPPDSELTMKATTGRTIKYLIIHCTAGHNDRTPADTMRGFFNPDGRDWEYGGYHWMVMNNGVATRCYPDDVQTNGATAMNPTSIHLNWIGGFNKKWGYRPMNGNPIKSDDSWDGKKGVAPSLGVTEEEAYRRLYGFGSKKLEGWNGGDASTRNGNLISQPQVFTLYKLIKRYIEIYPNIKVIGHNQVAAKNCPLFDVPTFMKLKFEGNNTQIGKARGNNYHPHRPSLIENARYIADSLTPI